MRALIHITLLLTLLLIGGKKMHATVHKVSSAPNLTLNSPFTTHHDFLHSKRGHSSSLIVFNDFDLNEENSSNDNYNSLGDSNLFKFKKTEFSKWYISGDNSFIISFPYNKFYFTKPISGQSTPIYITQSVLRI